MSDPIKDRSDERPDSLPRQGRAVVDSVLYRRLHAHPVTAAATKAVVTLVGGAVLVAGVVMLVTPGPAFVVIPAGLALLATEWPWARRLLVRARVAAEKARHRTLAVSPGVGRRRALVAALVAGAVMVGAVVAVAGMTLGLWSPGPLAD